MLLQGDHRSIALVLDDGRKLTYGEVGEQAHEVSNEFVARHPVFVFAHAGPDVVLALLGAFEAEAPVGLFDDRAGSAPLVKLAQEYRPPVVIAATEELQSVLCASGYVQDGRLPVTGTPILRCHNRAELAHESLGLLLSTSGSTGSPKLVRLSRRNVWENAVAIARALDLEVDDCGPTFLPLCYGYGLSVVTSHLVVGATVVLAAAGPASRRSLELARNAGMTSMSGVPATFRLARGAGVLDRLPGTTRRLCSSGARIPSELLDTCVSAADRVGASVYSMYGQTEATTRITVLPPELLPAHPASVGLPIGDGRISVVPRDGSEAGEVVYSGSSAMLGYARTRADLAKGDEQQGSVHTGDLGMLDDQGLLYLKGRMSRIAKISGMRVNLDEIEQFVDPEGRVAAVEDEDGDRVVLFVEASPQPFLSAHVVRRKLCRLLRVGPEHVLVLAVEALPRTSSGKVSYSELASPAR